MVASTTVTFEFNQSANGTQFYDWSNTANWSNGQLPSSMGGTADVFVAPFSSIPLDDISSLTIHSLTFQQGAPTLQIGANDVLTVTGSVGGGSISLGSGAELLEVGTGLSYVTLAGAGSVLEMGGTPRGYLQFSQSNQPGSFYIQNPQAGPSPGVDQQFISNFSGADHIYLEETASGPLTAIYTPGSGAAGTLVINEAGVPIYKFVNFRGNSAFAYQATETTVVDPLTGAIVNAVDVYGCFARGTRIATPGGERRVETLLEGEAVLVLEAGETRPSRVRWVGHRRLDLTTHPRPELASPIRIKAGALADGLPLRDLVVSPDHGLSMNGALIAAKLLVNGMTIVQEREAPAVTYYHVELDRHAILLAEGVAAESYLDTGNRGFFANSDLPLVLHPDLTAMPASRPGACAPLMREAAEIEPIWRRLAERAQSLGFIPSSLPVTTDPEPLLVVNGVTLRPIGRSEGRYRFVVPAGAKTARLVSRVFLPADACPYVDDWRRLGLAVSAITLQTGSASRAIAVDDPALSAGWHAPERSGGRLWRWTDGNASLPLGCAEGGILEVIARPAGAYRLQTNSTERLAA